MNKLKWVGLIVLVLIILVAGFLVFNRFFSPPKEDNLPQFIQTDWLDLEHVESISKFRSAMGHSYIDSDEACRSMKHYYNLKYSRQSFPWRPDGPLVPPPDPGTGLPIYSPVDGQITGIQNEGDFGEQIFIEPQSQPKFTMRLFHIYPIEGMREGQTVKAGQKIGEIRRDQNTDIAIETHAVFGKQFYSYFEVMPDSVFTRYQALGISSRDQIVFSKEQRDANPLECQNERFAKRYEDDPSFVNEIVYLSAGRD